MNSFTLVLLLFVNTFFALSNASDSKNIVYKHSPLLTNDINFIHTTDTHTWLKNKFGVDWGNYYDFLKSFRSGVESKGQDLIVIDTGDKIDGNGIGDATIPKGIMSYEVFNMNMDNYDLLTLGNHELYTESSSTIEYYNTAKNNDKYVCSNVEYLDDGQWTAFGQKYKYFKTNVNKKNVLAISFLFDFQRFNALTKVTPIEKEIEKDWFKKDLLEKFNDENVDILIVFGHLVIQHGQNQELLLLHNTLRKHFKNTVIQYFGGHSHIRDFVSIDDKSTAMQSGRFCETLGFVSINLDQEPSFFRKYVDFTKQSFDYHLKNIEGDNINWNIKNVISRKIDNLYKILNLEKVVGYIPSTYYMSGKPLTSPSNLFNLIRKHVLKLLEKPEGRENIKRIITINTGLIRSDLFEGNFTENTKFQVSPYENKWKYITLPYHFAKHINEYLNTQSSIVNLMALPSLSSPKSKPVMDIEFEYLQKHDESTFKHRTKLPMGPVTCDDFGCDGEDTLHEPLRYYKMPNVVEYSDVVNSETEEVDYVYLDFFELEVFKALETMNYNGLIKGTSYDASSVVPLLQKYFNMKEQNDVDLETVL
ncbi:unnamed protein product [Hanseniaspora opuntiae]